MSAFFRGAVWILRQLGVAQCLSGWLKLSLCVDKFWCSFDRSGLDWTGVMSSKLRRSSRQHQLRHVDLDPSERLDKPSGQPGGGCDVRCFVIGASQHCGRSDDPS